LNGRQALELYELKLTYRGMPCPVCGNPMDAPQMAHRIPKHKKYLRRYGPAVIHNRLNMVAVCSLACNSAVLIDPATHPIEAGELAKTIRDDLIKSG